MNTGNRVAAERGPADRATLRWIIYGLLILASAGSMTGRILAVKSKSGRTPMLSANDRSRWAAIRALVDHGTFEIDRVSFQASGKRDPEWQSIDMVRHRGRDGREHYYSSKPTLFTTLMAIPYGIVRQLFGWTLAGQPFQVIRTLLLLVNVLPLLVTFALLAWMVERLGTTDFSRLMTMTAATFGTFLTTFAVTLNNHLPAAMGVAATLAVVFQIGWYGRHHLGWFALAGLLAAFTAANELPALSFFCLVGALLFWIAPRPTLLGFVPAALLVLAASLGTNYVAHGSWKTPYAHRNDGPVVATLPQTDPAQWQPGRIADDVQQQLESAGLNVGPAATLSTRPASRGLVLWDPEQQRRWAVQFEHPKAVIRAWDNWYEYEGSYWSSGKKQGVDRGEPSKLVYAFHATFGHHGVFSLTPLWLVSVYGAGRWLKRGTTSQQALAFATVLLTAVCLTFYIFLRPLEDRNYGGVSCCLRWTVWLIPLWLLCLLPACDAISERRWLRRTVGLLLAVSVLSATYNGLNPWSHPWIFDYWTYLGWIRY